MYSFPRFIFHPFFGSNNSLLYVWANPSDTLNWLSACQPETAGSFRCHPRCWCIQENGGTSPGSIAIMTREGLELQKCRSSDHKEHQDPSKVKGFLCMHRCRMHAFNHSCLTDCMIYISRYWSVYVQHDAALDCMTWHYMYKGIIVFFYVQTCFLQIFFSCTRPTGHSSFMLWFENPRFKLMTGIQELNLSSSWCFMELLWGNIEEWYSLNLTLPQHQKGRTCHVKGTNLLMERFSFHLAIFRQKHPFLYFLELRNSARLWLWCCRPIFWRSKTDFNVWGSAWTNLQGRKISPPKALL